MEKVRLKNSIMQYYSLTKDINDKAHKNNKIEECHMVGRNETSKQQNCQCSPVLSLHRM